MKKETEKEKPVVKKRGVIETLRIILGNEASGFYTLDELEKIREDELARKRLALQVASQMPVDVRTTEEYKKAKWWKKLYMFFCYLLGNTRGEGQIPEHVLRDLARLLLPHILALYETDEGKKELARWKTEQEQQDAANREQSASCSEIKTCLLKTQKSEGA